MILSLYSILVVIHRVVVCIIAIPKEKKPYKSRLPAVFRKTI
jgi:hypothetical protein